MKELREYRRLLIQRIEAVGQEITDLVLSLEDCERLPTLPDGSSLFQHLAHLRRLELDVYLPLLERLASSGPSLPPAATGNGAVTPETVQGLAVQYREIRAQQAAWLRTLPDSTWNLIHSHPVTGERTFQWWVELSLAHAEEHLRLLRQHLEP